MHIQMHIGVVFYLKTACSDKSEQAACVAKLLMVGRQFILRGSIYNLLILWVCTS